MTDLTLRQLEYFVSAADSGTFSEAGRKFGVTQSAISLAMTELERLLDVQLFVRRKAKGPSLTAAGRELLVDARRLVLHSRDFQNSARSVGHGVSGELTVGCFPTISPYVMGSVLQGLPRRHPQLTLNLVEDSVHGLQQRLLDGRCEIAIMYDIGISADMHTTALYACAPYVVLPRNHRLATAEHVTFADLIDEPMIMIDMPPSSDFFLGLLARAGFSPTIRYRGNTIETVRALIGRGMGWGLLLHQPIPTRSYDGGFLVNRDLSGNTETVDVLAVRSAGIRATRRVEAFIDHCRATLPIT